MNAKYYPQLMLNKMNEEITYWRQRFLDDCDPKGKDAKLVVSSFIDTPSITMMKYGPFNTYKKIKQAILEEFEASSE